MAFIYTYPLIHIALTITVIILIGAITTRILLPKSIEVARNCFVVSSPKSWSKGAKSVKSLFARFPPFTIGDGVAVAVLVDVTVAMTKAKAS
jgi:hypothetical protein